MCLSGAADTFMLRMPEGFRDFVKSEAAKNKRSMNAEIIYQLERANGAKKKAGSLPQLNIDLKDKAQKLLESFDESQIPIAYITPHGVLLPCCVSTPTNPLISCSLTMARRMRPLQPFACNARGLCRRRIACAVQTKSIITETIASPICGALAAGYLYRPFGPLSQGDQFPLPPSGGGADVGMHAAAFLVGVCGMWISDAVFEAVNQYLKRKV